MVQSSIREIKAQGCLIQIQFQTIFQEHGEHANMHDLKSFSKLKCCFKRAQTFKNKMNSWSMTKRWTCMQQLSHNSTSKPCFGSTLHQYDMNHARINLKHEQEDNGATFSLVVQEGSSNKQSTLQQFFNFQAIHKVELNFSPSPPLGRLSTRNELKQCFDWSVYKAQHVLSSGR